LMPSEPRSLPPRPSSVKIRHQAENIQCRWEEHND
jgi:hypothetical protein